MVERGPKPVRSVEPQTFSKTQGHRGKTILVEGTAGTPRQLHVGSLGGISESIITPVKTTTTQFSNQILSQLPRSSGTRGLFEGSIERITYNSQGNPLPKNPKAFSGNTTSSHNKRKPINTGAQGPSVKNLTKTFRKGQANGSKQSSKENTTANTTSAVVQKTETTTPTPAHRTIINKPSIKATVINVISAGQKVESITTHNPREMQTAITETQLHSTNLAKKVENPNILPSRTQKPTMDVQRLVNSANSIRTNGNDILGMRFENSNFTQKPQKKITKNLILGIDTSSSTNTPLNVGRKRGLPRGLNIAGDIASIRAEEELPPAPHIMPKTMQKSLNRLKQETTSNNITLSRTNGNDILGMRFENSNFTQKPHKKITKNLILGIDTSSSTNTPLNVGRKRGLPRGLNIAGDIASIRAEEELPPAPHIMPKTMQKSLNRLKQETTSNNITLSRASSTGKSIVATHESQVQRPKTQEETIRQVLAPEELVRQEAEAAASQRETEIGTQPFKKNTSIRANRRRAAREQRQQLAQQPTQSGLNTLPFKNLENLVQLVQEQGFHPQKEGGIMVEPIYGFRRTKSRNTRKSKKTLKKLKYNIEKKQILERKIKKAEEAARSGPSFLSKVLGGFGFYPGDGRDPNQYIQGLQSKIQKLDSTIAESEAKLKTQLKTATDNQIRGNLRAEQKAIARTKHYRDLLSQYITGETTVRKERAAKAKTIKNIATVRKERAAKAKTIKNITLTPGNTRAISLGNSIQKLFNNNAATKKAEAIVLLQTNKQAIRKKNPNTTPRNNTTPAHFTSGESILIGDK